MKGESELFSLKILNLEKRICLQNLIHLRREIFLQNLEFREENENFFFKILTIEIISRNENSILQREREQMDHFLSRFSQGRESRQCRGGAVCVGVEGVLLAGPVCDELNFTPIL